MVKPSEAQVRPGSLSNQDDDSSDD